MTVIDSVAGAPARSRPLLPAWRTVAYWTFTLLIAYEMVAGSLWDLLRIEYVRVILASLGYPEYLLLVIGVWKLPCALALLAPGTPRLKEWAYAGAAINYYGATASHFLNGDAAAKWIAPLVFLGLLMASWALRPPERRIPPAPAVKRDLRAYLVPLGLAVAFVVLAAATLPEGPPPP